MACEHEFVRDSVEVTEIAEDPDGQVLCLVVACKKCEALGYFGVGANEMNWVGEHTRFRAPRVQRFWQVDGQIHVGWGWEPLYSAFSERAAEDYAKDYAADAYQLARVTLMLVSIP